MPLRHLLIGFVDSLREANYLSLSFFSLADGLPVRTRSYFATDLAASSSPFT